MMKFVLLLLYSSYLSDKFNAFPPGGSFFYTSNGLGFSMPSIFSPPPPLFSTEMMRVSNSEQKLYSTSPQTNAPKSWNLFHYPHTYNPFGPYGMGKYGQSPMRLNPYGMGYFGQPPMNPFGLFGMGKYGQPPMNQNQNGMGNYGQPQSNKNPNGMGNYDQPQSNKNPNGMGNYDQTQINQNPYTYPFNVANPYLGGMTNPFAYMDPYMGTTIGFPYGFGGSPYINTYNPGNSLSMQSSVFGLTRKLRDEAIKDKKNEERSKDSPTQTI